MTKLIFRIDPGDQLTRVLELQRPLGHYTDIADDRLGEEVLFGTSDVPGIWNVLAFGRFARWTSDDRSIHFTFEDVRLLRQPVAIVTEGDPESDRLFEPYLLDTLLDDDLALIFGRDLEFVQAAASPISVAAEEQAHFGVGHVVGGLGHAPQEPGFFHSVADAYGWCCAVSGIKQTSLDGRIHEGVVLGIEEPHVRQQGVPRDGMFLSSSFAFAYRHGLVAIGDDYSLIMHSDMPAPMQVFLETSNPEARLRVPENRADWPDKQALRRHRQRFGY